jgi:hypothetical protein
MFSARSRLQSGLSYGKLDPDVMVMKSAEDRQGKNDADGLHGSG